MTALSRLAAALLALAAGYTDAFAYVRYDVFAANMTGNVVLLSIAVVKRDIHEVVRHAAPICVFLLGVMASRLVRQVDRSGVASLLLAVVILLLVAGFDPSPGLLAACALSAAMGAQNSAFSRFDGVPLNTAFLTGDLQRLGHTLVEPGPQRGRWNQAFTTAVTIVAYALGAGLGALSVGFNAPALLLSAALLAVVAGLAYATRDAHDALAAG